MATYTITFEGKKTVIHTGSDGAVSLEGKDDRVSVVKAGDDRFSVLIGCQSIPMAVRRADEGYEVVLGGRQVEVQVESERKRLLNRLQRAKGHGHKRLEIRAPMPALVVRVEVRPGDEIRPGQGLLVLEAMKMENELKAHNAGTVKEILVGEGKPVEKGELLIILE